MGFFWSVSVLCVSWRHNSINGVSLRVVAIFLELPDRLIIAIVYILRMILLFTSHDLPHHLSTVSVESLALLDLIQPDSP